MKRLLAAVAILSPSLAHAAEFGILRPLQHGPIGDSPQFIDVKNLEVEGMFQGSQTWGKYQINGDPERQVNAYGYKTLLAAGGAWAPSKDLLLTAYASATPFSGYGERQTRGEKTSELDTGLYRHEFAVFAVYKSNPLVLGGGIGGLMIGGEDRSFKYVDGSSSAQSYQEASRTGLPTLRLFGGISTRDFDGTLGVRFFSMGDSVVSSYERKGGKKTGEYDLVRRNPGEVHLDGRLNLSSGYLAGSLAYVLHGQASEQVDEWSNRYAQVGNTKIRQTGDGRRNTDQIRAAVGGRYEPSKIFGLLGGLSYLSSFYDKVQYASVEHENLGGFRLDVGGDLELKPFKGYAQLGYLLDNRVSSTQNTDERANTRLDQAQRFPLAAGDQIKTSQGRWDITVGGGMVF
jgi:hypothetical protein